MRDTPNVENLQLRDCQFRGPPDDLTLNFKSITTLSLEDGLIITLNDIIPLIRAADALEVAKLRLFPASERSTSPNIQRLFDALRQHRSTLRVLALDFPLYPRYHDTNDRLWRESRGPRPKQDIESLRVSTRCTSTAFISPFDNFYPPGFPNSCCLGRLNKGFLPETRSAYFNRVSLIATIGFHKATVYLHRNGHNLSPEKRGGTTDL